MTMNPLTEHRCIECGETVVNAVEPDPHFARADGTPCWGRIDYHELEHADALLANFQIDNLVDQIMVAAAMTGMSAAAVHAAIGDTLADAAEGG